MLLTKARNVKPQTKLVPALQHRWHAGRADALSLSPCVTWSSMTSQVTSQNVTWGDKKSWRHPRYKRIRGSSTALALDWTIPPPPPSSPPPPPPLRSSTTSAWLTGQTETHIYDGTQSHEHESPVSPSQCKPVQAPHQPWLAAALQMLRQKKKRRGGGGVVTGFSRPTNNSLFGGELGQEMSTVTKIIHSSTNHTPCWTTLPIK